MIPLGKVITLVTRVARRLADYRYRYVILNMEGLIITFLVLIWTTAFRQVISLFAFWFDTYAQMRTPGFSSETSVRGLYCLVSINSERKNMTSMTTYGNNKALKLPFFFLLVMRVSRKLEYHDCI